LVVTFGTSSLSRIWVRRIGMIGGMSWESSAIYYWMIDELIRARMGGHHSTETVMYSVEFACVRHPHF